MGWREDVDIMQQHQTIDWLKCIICQKEGPKTKCQSTGKPSQAALTLAQILKFNSVKHTRKTEECTRLFKSQETPLPVHIGVMLYMKTRKRDLIDRLHSLAMSISSDKVLRLSSDMANAVCEHFKQTDTVCPPNLKTTYSLQPRLIISTLTLRQQRQLDHFMSPAFH